MEITFSQYEEYDGVTLKRAWQSLFQVYNEKLCKMGRNEFSVEHTGVMAWQRAGTLDMVLKRGQETLRKAWNYLASFTNDGEDDSRVVLFLPVTCLPLEKGLNTTFLGADWFVCRHSRIQGGACENENTITGSN